jgi:hypothetical protein
MCGSIVGPGARATKASSPFRKRAGRGGRRALARRYVSQEFGSRSRRCSLPLRPVSDTRTLSATSTIRSRRSTLGARLILQQALEDELSEFLGRERYERRGEPLSHRNGYERVRVKTTAGPLELERPRVRNVSALGFCSEIVGKGWVARTGCARCAP